MKHDLGYYHVNGISFGTNKVSAVLEAQRTNSNLNWYFFDEILNSVNWLVEPDISLDMLYKMRAIQLREKYDYLVAFLSGGADSNNVIRTFMNNGIHIDEVVAMIPETGLKNFDSNQNDYSAGNVMSEIKFAQYPILQEVYKRSPNTKVTVVDFFDNMINEESDSWIYQSEGDLIGMAGRHYGNLESVTHIKQLAEQGKKIGCIWGTDKPVLKFLPNGDIYSIIADSPVYLGKYPFKKFYPNVDRLLFYYSHELPEIMVKQAHVVLKEIVKPENAHIYKAVIDQTTRTVTHGNLSSDKILNNILTSKTNNFSYSPKTVYQRGIVPFIYPSTHDPSLFQTRKFDLSGTFLPAFGDWITNLHGKSRIREMMVSDFTLFYNTISPKYLNANKTGFQMCIKAFKIGQQNFTQKIKNE